MDQHAGGKRLIHDTKRRKDNQLQSLKLPCRISKLSSYMWHKGVRYLILETEEVSHDVLYVLRPWRESMQNFIFHLRRSEFLTTSFVHYVLRFKKNSLKSHVTFW